MSELEKLRLQLDAWAGAAGADAPEPEERRLEVLEARPSRSFLFLVI